MTERNRIETGSATFGINKFADLSEKEFSSYYLTATPPDFSHRNNSNILTHVPKYEGTQSLVDWTGVYTTPVKDQGYCGSW